MPSPFAIIIQSGRPTAAERGIPPSAPSYERAFGAYPDPIQKLDADSAPSNPLPSSQPNPASRPPDPIYLHEPSLPAVLHLALDGKNNTTSPSSRPRGASIGSPLRVSLHRRSLSHEFNRASRSASDPTSSLMPVEEEPRLETTKPIVLTNPADVPRYPKSGTVQAYDMLIQHPFFAFTREGWVWRSKVTERMLVLFERVTMGWAHLIPDVPRGVLEYGSPHKEAKVSTNDPAPLDDGPGEAREVAAPKGDTPAGEKTLKKSASSKSLAFFSRIGHGLTHQSSSLSISESIDTDLSDAKNTGADPMHPLSLPHSSAPSIPSHPAPAPTPLPPSPLKAHRKSLETTLRTSPTTPTKPSSTYRALTPSELEKCHNYREALIVITDIRNGCNLAVMAARELREEVLERLA